MVMIVVRGVHTPYVAVAWPDVAIFFSFPAHHHQRPPLSAFVLAVGRSHTPDHPSASLRVSQSGYGLCGCDRTRSSRCAHVVAGVAASAGSAYRPDTQLPPATQLPTRNMEEQPVQQSTHTRAQPSTSSIQTVRYEDSKEGTPPRKITPSTSTATDAAPRSHPTSLLSRRRPPFDTISLLSEQVKRDSGIAPSVSASLDNSSSPIASTLPTIVVQDDESSSLVDERNGTSPPARPTPETVPSLRTRSAATSPRITKMSSFTGIQSSIPTATMFTTDELDFDDLATDKITFSQRGSLMFGGRRMQDLIAAQGPDYHSEREALSNPLSAEEAQVSPPQQETEPQTEKSSPQSNNTASPVLDGQQPKRGLVTGRRKPSMQMLQAAVQGRRVLSVEEVTFSRKVRSMYDCGDERGADWTSIDGVLSGKNTPTVNGRGSTTPEVSHEDLSVSRARRAASVHSSRTSRSTNPRSSFYSRESNELAGGIEDWGDIDSRDVDRYGFIHQGRAASRASNAPSALSDAVMPGVQRVATSLRLEVDQGRREHRKLTRGKSATRSSRSMPPRSRDGVKRGPESIRSTHSNASRTHSVFRHRNRSEKTLAGASDMLTLPPHLAAIQEDEDVGKNASALKQREWKREQKWQDMAHPVRHRTDGKGGGMRFEFDIDDPKLVERTWKGIPDRWRATAWHSFLSASAKRRNSPATDEELIGQFHKLQEMNSSDDVQIDVDVPRTVNMHIMFRRRYRGGQRLLFRVLHAVSLYFPDVGYVQGMASLAATLLCYFDEEKAFVMIVRMWQLRGLEQLFQDGFAGLMSCLGQFEEEWLGNGDVAAKLKELCIASTAYGTRWYLTLFNMSIPFPAQLRVWDVFMLLGDNAVGSEPGAFGGADLDILHATSAALVDATREILLDSDFENAMKVLTSFIPIKDEDVLMRVAKAEYRMKKKRTGIKV